ncbi:MAG: trans-sulfuration enzyme family protein [Gaiellaceae bacterium]
MASDLEPHPELSWQTRLAQLPTRPLERSTIWPYEGGEPGRFVYQRYEHPLTAAAEQVLGQMEGGESLLFGSGMAAVTGILLSAASPGMTIAVPQGAYYGTSLLVEELGRWGLRLLEFDQTAPPPAGAGLVWLEPCSNPLLSFPDLDASIAAAHARGALVAVDATVLTPLLLRPLEHGADFAVHSATKLLSGHHDVVLGLVSCRESERAESLRRLRRLSGLIAAPDPVWLLLRSLKTLPLRAGRSSANALELALRLARHPAVEAVHYPGLDDPVAARYVSEFGPLLSFVVRGGEGGAGVLERSLQLIANATSLGGSQTTIEARARWEGARVPGGLLRLSAGLEDVEDLWRDLEQALGRLPR